MSLWTKAALGAAAAVACAGGAVAQVPGPVAPVPVAPGMVATAPAGLPGTTGCAACNGGVLKPGVANTIPKCDRHNGLTQYPWSEKRYIKQFCNPTICPNSCFGHFKTQWTAWPQACPGWPTDGVDPANHGPNYNRYEHPAQAQPPAAPAPAAAAPAAVTPAAPAAPEPKPVDTTPAVPPSKPLDLPTSKPAAPKVDAPVPMPTIPAPPVKLPDPPPAGNPGGRF